MFQSLPTQGPKQDAAFDEPMDAYRQLFDGILSQRLAPGTKLNEVELTLLFGVSRTLIRQALQRLQLEHVVEIHKNRGAFVAAPSPDLAEQILLARHTIELAVVGLACLRCKPTDVQQLQHMIDLEQSAIDQGDMATALRRSGEFHLQLAIVAGNQPFVHALRGLISQTSLIITMYSHGGGNACARDEHSLLLDAVRLGDEVLSQQLMAHHLGHIAEGCDFTQQPQVANLKGAFAHLS
ncbi:MAG: GntR family transcriptional regulator [Gammaproteobacteria bacterium]|nr:GntR family transcriptional regulator [Gammaproteobacteria bacterium]